MASEAVERQALLEAYPRPSTSGKSKSPWEERVEKMSKGQVHAIYIRLKDQGVIK